MVTLQVLPEVRTQVADVNPTDPVPPTCDQLTVPVGE
jgi:hypothetical protein